MGSAHARVLRPLILWSVVVLLLSPVAPRAKEITLALSPGKNPSQLEPSEVRGWRGHAVLIRNVIDMRKNAPPGQSGGVLGLSVQRNDEPYTTKDSIAPWLTRSIMFVFSVNGIGVVRDNPSIIVEPTLKYLFVTEESTYKGKAIIGFAVYNAAGTKIWDEEACDSSNYWGSTLSEEEVLYALGNAVVNTVGILLRDPPLNDSLAQQPKPAAGQANLLEIHQPEDLGIRGNYRSQPRGATIFGGALLVAATAVLIGTQSSTDTKGISLLCIPFYIAGGVLGTIAAVKWGLWYNWYHIKPASGSTQAQLHGEVDFNLP